MRNHALLARLARYGWQVDDSESTILDIIGPLPPLPDAVIWGHPAHPASAPVWVYCQPEKPTQCAMRIWRYRPHDAVMWLGTPTDLATWESVWHLGATMPFPASILVVPVEDLRRGIARLVRRKPG